MIRCSTALVLLLSLVAVPLTLTACVVWCESFATHQQPACREKAHAYLGPHVHHMHHVHMVDEEAEVDSTAHHEQPKHLVTSLGCSSGSCARMSEAVPSRIVARSSKIGVFSSLATVTVCSVPIISHPTSSDNAEETSLSDLCSSSLPLRI